MSIVEFIEEHKVVDVIRKADEDNIIPIVQALYEGGVYIVEITAETPGVTNLIEKAVKEFKGKVAVGAGTVLDPETARAMIMAGAEFIVSPTLNTETLNLSRRYGILAISGAFSPTEILTAYEYGSEIVKVFPAGVLGPEYIKNLKGPLPQIKIMVTGGITYENMDEYIASGCSSVGIGSNLVNAKKLKTQEDYVNLTKEENRFSSKVI